MYIYMCIYIYVCMYIFPKIFALCFSDPHLLVICVCVCLKTKKKQIYIDFCFEITDSVVVILFLALEKGSVPNAMSVIPMHSKPKYKPSSLCHYVSTVVTTPACGSSLGNVLDFSWWVWNFPVEWIGCSTSFLFRSHARKVRETFKRIM